MNQQTEVSVEPTRHTISYIQTNRIDRRPSAVWLAGLPKYQEGPLPDVETREGPHTRMVRNGTSKEVVRGQDIKPPPATSFKISIQYNGQAGLPLCGARPKGRGGIC